MNILQYPMTCVDRADVRCGAIISYSVLRPFTWCGIDRAPCQSLSPLARLTVSRRGCKIRHSGGPRQLAGVTVTHPLTASRYTTGVPKLPNNNVRRPGCGQWQCELPYSGSARRQHIAVHLDILCLCRDAAGILVFTEQHRPRHPATSIAPAAQRDGNPTVAFAVYKHPRRRDGTQQ